MLGDEERQTDRGVGPDPRHRIGGGRHERHALRAVRRQIETRRKVGQEAGDVSPHARLITRREHRPQPVAQRDQPRQSLSAMGRSWP